MIAWFIGWPTLLGALAIPLIAVIQLYFARSIALLREKSTSFADKRVSLTAEAVRGIRVVKMSTWEQSYQQIILDTRRFVILYMQYNSFLCVGSKAVVCHFVTYTVRTQVRTSQRYLFLFSICFFFFF